MSIYFYGCITMDGYLADEAHKLDWLYQTGTIAETDYEEFYKKIDFLYRLQILCKPLSARTGYSCTFYH